MHSAPSVTYPVGRSLFFGGLLAFAWLLGALLVGWWCLGVAAMGWRQWLAVLALPLGAACAGRSWRAMVPGELRWDGQAWLWRTPGTEAGPVGLHVHLDFQQHLLLCLRQGSGRSVWCWAERRLRPERWGDLRRAVYSPARSQAVSDDAPLPPVKPAPASPET